MEKIEYREVFQDEQGAVYFDGSLLEKNGYGVFDLIEAFNTLGEDGWSLTLSYKDVHGILNFIMKRSSND